MDGQRGTIYDLPILLRRRAIVEILAGWLDTGPHGVYVCACVCEVEGGAYMLMVRLRTRWEQDSRYSEDSKQYELSDVSGVKCGCEEES